VSLHNSELLLAGQAGSGADQNPPPCQFQSKQQFMKIVSKMKFMKYSQIRTAVGKIA
jgi:hypothetical protein